ncbi:anthrone oxygenase family protein [Streptomyces panaciradicis]|uniref:anthrone oxygenase family protein n=1 Tax=Streptomyces panaciradicis TaxID=1470261 RepID=UPI00201D03F5|nr:anthrone oxygenase family protein [Streptomyces panaciradicis]MCL6673910.1 DUF1772 domain-containing protein [Streptomyces panaciradicis]
MTRNRTAAGAVLGAATVTMGLIAGVYFVFACCVMPALARSDDRTYVQVMNDVNDVIQNPVFFLAFLGAPVLTAVSAWQLRDRPCRSWIRTALAACALGFLTTIAFNIPLNDALAHAADPTTARAHFEGPWVAWNAVRAGLTVVALGCLARALVLYGRRTPPPGPSGGG